MDAGFAGRLAVAAMIVASVSIVGCGLKPEPAEISRDAVVEQTEELGPTADGLDAAARKAYHSFLVSQVKGCEQLELGHPLVSGAPWSALAQDNQWERLESYAITDLDGDSMSELIIRTKGDEDLCYAFAYDVDDGSVTETGCLDNAAIEAEPDWAPLTAARLGIPSPEATDAELLAFAELAKDDMRMAIAGMKLGVFVAGGEGDFSFEENGYLYYRVPGTSIDEVKDLWYGCFSRRYEIDEVTGMPFPYVERDGKTYVARSNMGDEGEDIVLDSAIERADDEAWFTGTATGLITGDTRPIRMSLVLEDGAWKYGSMEWGEAEDTAPFVGQVTPEDPSTWVGTWKTEAAEGDPDVTVTLSSDGTFSLEGDIWGSGDIWIQDYGQWHVFTGGPDHVEGVSMEGNSENYSIGLSHEGVLTYYTYEANSPIHKVEE